MNQKTVMEWQWCQCVGFGVIIMLAQWMCLVETTRGKKIIFVCSFRGTSVHSRGREEWVSQRWWECEAMAIHIFTDQETEKVGNQGPGCKCQSPVPTDLVLLVQLHLCKDP